METIKKIFSDLPLDKLTPNGVLIVSVLIIIVIVVITAINKKTNKIEVEDKRSKIDGLKLGNSKNSSRSKSIKLKLEDSNIKNSEIGCTTNDKKGE